MLARVHEPAYSELGDFLDLIVFLIFQLGSSGPAQEMTGVLSIVLFGKTNQAHFRHLFRLLQNGIITSRHITINHLRQVIIVNKKMLGTHFFAKIRKNRFRKSDTRTSWLRKCECDEIYF